MLVYHHGKFGRYWAYWSQNKPEINSKIQIKVCHVTSRWKHHSFQLAYTNVCWSTILPGPVVSGLMKQYVKPFMIIICSSCGYVIITYKIESVMLRYHPPSLIVTGFLEVEIQPETLVTWPRHDDIIVTCKTRSVHTFLSFCQFRLL